MMNTLFFMRVYGINVNKSRFRGGEASMEALAGH